MTELHTLADLAEIFGAVVVVGGLAFAVIQMLHYRRQRQETAAIELLRSFQNPEFSRSLRAVLALPRGVGSEEMTERGRGDMDAVMMVILTFESIGLMVFRGIVPLQMVNELLGGVCVESWARLERYMQELRAESNRKTISEWFQWLAERLKEQHTRNGRLPAYDQHRHWHP